MLMHMQIPPSRGQRQYIRRLELGKRQQKARGKMNDRNTGIRGKKTTDITPTSWAPYRTGRIKIARIMQREWLQRRNTPGTMQLAKKNGTSLGECQTGTMRQCWINLVHSTLGLVSAPLDIPR